jgi:pilus assembly protein CpaE
MLRSIAADHSSGLSVIAAPRDNTPLDILSNEQSLSLVETAMREFGTVFIDLPHNWTNWSLSLLARADVIVLVTQVRIASLNRARRQIDLLESQELGGAKIHVVVNRADKGLFKTINVKDAERVLGRAIAHTVANDHETMSAAIEQGVPVTDIRRKGPLIRDLDSMTTALLETLAVEP